MNNYIYKLLLINPYNIGAFESWLTDLSKNGIHIRKANAMFAKFVIGEPSDISYRIQMSNNRCNEEKKDFYKSCGWEYITKIRWAHILKSNSNLIQRELQSDTKEYKNSLNQIVNLVLFRLFLASILFIVINLYSINLFVTSTTPIQSVLNMGSILFTMIILSYVYLRYIIDLYLELLNTKKRIIRGCTLEHNINWKTYRTKSKLVIIIIFTLLLLQMVSILLSKDNSVSNMNNTLFEKSIPYISLKSLNCNNELVTQIDEGTINYLKSGVNSRNILIKNNYNTFEMIESNSSTNTCFQHVIYYKLRFKVFSEALFYELLQSQILSNSISNIRIKNISYEGWDKVLQVEGDNNYYIVGKKNNIILFVQYQGVFNNNEYINEFLNGIK